MSDSKKLRVWDLPTRLFHWLLVVCVIGAYIAVKAGWMDTHLLFGYSTLGLVLFRIIWGFVGSGHARFASFVRGPRAILAYLRGTAPRQPGHNPLGALSILAMLALFGYHTVLGLFSNDDVMTEGPLAGYVDKDTSDFLTGLHIFDEKLILGLVALHVAAIIWYRVVRKQRLVSAMVTGDAPADEFGAGAAPAADNAGILLRALVVAAIAAAIVAGIVSLRPAAAF